MSSRGTTLAVLMTFCVFVTNPIPSPAETDVTQATWFLVAIKKGDVEKVKRLLAEDRGYANCRSESAENTGRGPLHVAVVANRPDLVELLLDHDSEVEAKDKSENTPLHFAAGVGLVEDQTGAPDPGKNPAVEKPKGVLELLLSRRASVTAKNKHGEIPLHRAAHAGRVHAVKRLVDLKFPVDVRDGSKNTPLYLACEKGHFEIAKFLASKGADVKAQCYSDYTPLHAAALAVSPELVVYLLDRGARVNAIGGFASTPLHFAAAKGSLECVKSLVQKGASLQARDKSDMTPLKWAKKGGHDEIVRFLLSKGAVE